MALLSAEAEYIAASDAACKAIWVRRILKALKFEQKEPTTIFCDNMSAVAMTKNPVFHVRSKHIELRHHFIRELVNQGEIGMEFVKAEEKPADIMTKAVTTHNPHPKVKEKNILTQLVENTKLTNSWKENSRTLI